MNIYFSGIGGVGIGSLAAIAKSAGYTVFGSDQNPSPMTEKLANQNVEIEIGSQNGEFLKQKFIENGVDWFVYTAALPQGHPELKMARELGIKISKRDDLLNEIIQQKNLKMIAVSGTHGKTTTTGMLIWTLKQLGVPISWSVGATLTFGESGFFDPASQFFIYEADEFDRNFLHFSPFVSLITSMDHDHTDIYATEADYFAAFHQFAQQNDFLIAWQDQHGEIFSDLKNKAILRQADPEITLIGEHNRRNATLALEAIDFLANNGADFGENYWDKAISALNNFAGTDRRFEKIADGFYSDYGHHPVEIKATLELANEFAQKNGFDGVALVYQPHQNVRQVEVKDDYTPEVFADCQKVFWLPTYLSRENPELKILTPAELSEKIAEKTIVSDMNIQLMADLNKLREENFLILAMSAGSLDGWIRKNLK